VQIKSKKGETMKKFFSLFITLCAVPLLFGLSACQSGSKTIEAVVETPTASRIVAEGIVVPVKSVQIGFYPNGGVVMKVNKLLNDTVNAGDTIAVLTVTPQMQAALTAANAQLAAAENNLIDFTNQASVDHAQADLNVVLAQERLNKALDKRNDKAVSLKYSNSRDAKIEKEKAEADLILAQQQLDLAKASAEKVKNGPDPDRLSVLQTTVKNAKTQVAAAEAAVTSQSELISPISGVIAVNDLKEGQFVQAGAGLVTVADLSVWQVETTDLKETSVQEIKIGDPAMITFDALPGITVKGTISSIDPIGMDKQGDMTYRVVLSVESTPGLRWNMTANVEFSG
jgi:multidrug resistance efflux pump